VHQPALEARKNGATDLYEAIEARLIGGLGIGLQPGQYSTAEPWAERRRFEGMPRQGKVAIAAFCVFTGEGWRHAIVREASAGDRAGGWTAMPALGSSPDLSRMGRGGVLIPM
jgi:hypothetical protein